MAELNDHSVSLTTPASQLPGSPIRALLSQPRSVGDLDLGGGLPDPALFPIAEFSEVAADVLATEGDVALQYASTEGLEPLRGFIAARLARRGCEIGPEQIVITHGSQQALSAVAMLLTSPTAAVALEQPVYPGAQQAFALAQAKVVPLPVTRLGWELDALHRHRVAAIYAIPQHQNPTGRKASPEQCLALSRFAERSGTFIIEDDAYGELDFCSEMSRPLLADAPTRGILLGTFSKTLCPGLRVGWVAAPRALVPPLVRILQAFSLQPGTLAQHLAWGLVSRLDWDSHLQKLRSHYAERARRLRSCCSRLGLDSEAPSGGLFLWVRTSELASQFAERARQQGALVVPERAFRHPTYPGPDEHLRLAFSRFSATDSERHRLEMAFSTAQATAVA